MWWLQSCGDSQPKNACKKHTFGEIDGSKYSLTGLGVSNDHFNRPEIGVFVRKNLTESGMLVLVFDMNNDKLQAEPKRILSNFDGYVISQVASFGRYNQLIKVSAYKKNGQYFENLTKLMYFNTELELLESNPSIDSTNSYSQNRNLFAGEFSLRSFID